MDPKLAFWTWALAVLAAAVVFALLGVRQIRRRRVRSHQRLMLTAGSLIGLFLVSYVFKVMLLGRERLELWSAGARAVLYVHELCVAAMLLAGLIALLRALRFRGSLPAGELLPPEDSPSRARVAHRRAGWIAVAASILGFATASLVLAGMYARS